MLRILDKGDANKFTLESLGMSGDALDKFKRLLRQPHGIVLVTGPRARVRPPRCTRV